MVAKNIENAEPKAEFKWAKHQIVASKRYKDKIDLVNALLEDNKTYKLAEVDELIEKYMKGKVK